ncbi:Mitochondrial Translation Optimization, partial [Serendipita sp. 401]
GWAALGIQVNHDGVPRSAYELLKSPQIAIQSLTSVVPSFPISNRRVIERIAIEGAYSLHLKRQQADLEVFSRDESLELSQEIDYSAIQGLSSEVKDRLQKVKPSTIVRGLFF